MMPILLSPLAPQVVVKATYGAISDDNVGTMVTLSLQC